VLRFEYVPIPEPEIEDDEDLDVEPIMRGAGVIINGGTHDDTPDEPPEKPTSNGKHG
jgi:hypothetical protein